MAIPGLFNTPPSGRSLAAFSDYSATVAYPTNAVVRGSDTNLYIAQQATVGNSPTADAGTNWKLYAVSATVTLNIPSRFATFALAWAFAAPIVGVNGSARVIFKFADGTHTFGTTNFSLNHPFGATFDLTGNTATKANVILSFTGTGASTNLVNHGLFELTLGYSFGTIDGFTFTGPGFGAANYANSGFVMAEGSGSSVTVGPNVTGSNGYYLAHARSGAYIDASFCVATGMADGAFWAYAATMLCIGCDASAASNTFSGSGFLADNHAYMMLDGSHSYSNYHGLYITNGSSVRTNGTTIGQAIMGKDSGGTLHTNSVADVAFSNADYWASEGSVQTNSATPYVFGVTNAVQGGGTNGSNFQTITIGNGNYSVHDFVNNANEAQIGINKNGSGAYISSAPQLYVATISNIPLAFATNNTFAGQFNAVQSFGVGATSIDASAKVQIDSTTKGFLPPRMTSTQKNAISSPPEGLEVYDLTLRKKCVYTGAAWETVTSS